MNNANRSNIALLIHIKVVALKYIISFTKETMKFLHARYNIKRLRDREA